MQPPYSAQILSLEGADALAFAQAQFSSNLDALPVGRWQFSAWLDPQGRVRAFFHLARPAEQHLLLLLRGGNAQSLAGELKRFVFRSKLRVEAHPPRSLGTARARPLHVVEEADGGWLLGCGDHALEIGDRSDGAWRAPQILASWPWLPDRALDTFAPVSLGIDRLHATALDKGCYPGQEIVARLHYRGGNKRHLRALALSRAVAPGATLDDGGGQSLQLLDVVPNGAGALALGVMREDLATALEDGMQASLDGVAVTLHPLAPLPERPQNGA